MESVSNDIKRLLKEHPVLELINDGAKIKCTLTGHEMPCRDDVIKQHVQGKKFKRQMTFSEFDYDKYKPHIVPSEKKWFKLRKQLFCKLTLRHLNRDPSHLLRHVNGRRYKSALARWEECQRTGKVFHPRGGSRVTRKEQATDDDVTSETSDAAQGAEDVTWRQMEKNAEDDADESDTDSLADLYPAEDFEDDDVADGDVAANSDSDSEFEDDTEIPEPAKEGPKTGKKRKATVNENKVQKKQKKTQNSDQSKGNNPKKTNPNNKKKTPKKKRKTNT